MEKPGHFSAEINNRTQKGYIDGLLNGNRRQAARNQLTLIRIYEHLPARRALASRASVPQLFTSPAYLRAAQFSSVGLHEYQLDWYFFAYSIPIRAGQG
jgi:hypothetical protein